MAELASDSVAEAAFWSRMSDLRPFAVEALRRRANPAAALVRDIAAATPAFAAREAATRLERRVRPTFDPTRRITLDRASLVLLPAPRIGPEKSASDRRRHRLGAQIWRERMERIAATGELPPEARPITTPPPALAELVAQRRERLLNGYRRGRVTVVGMTPDRALEIAISAAHV